MKSYTEMTTEIELLLNSKESLDIYKEQCELEILSNYIDNQLYLREYTDKIVNTDLKINTLLEAVENKKLSWIKRVNDYVNKIANSLWNLIVGVSRWIASSVNTLWKAVSNMKVKETLQYWRNRLSSKNESVYTEDANAILQEIHQRFLQKYDEYKNMYSTFITKTQDKFDINKLSILINGIDINNLFNQNNQNNYNVENFMNKDFFLFNYIWHDDQDKSNKNTFLMMNIDTFDRLTSDMIDAVNRATGSLVEGAKLIDNTELFILKQLMKQQLKNTPGTKEYIKKQITEIVSTAGAGLISYITNYDYYSTKQVTDYVSFAIGCIAPSALKYFQNKKEEREAFTSNIEFEILNILKTVNDCNEKFNKSVIKELEEKGKMIENLLKKLNDDFEKIKNSSIKDKTINTALGLNIVNNTQSGVSALWHYLLPNIDNKLLSEINNSAYVAQAYKFFKKYTDININMMTIITFSTNIQDLIVKSLAVNNNANTNDNTNTNNNVVNLNKNK